MDVLLDGTGDSDVHLWLDAQNSVVEVPPCGQCFGREDPHTRRDADNEFHQVLNHKEDKLRSHESGRRLGKAAWLEDLPDPVFRRAGYAVLVILGVGTFILLPAQRP